MGDSVMMMSYASSPDSLLAKVEESEARSIRAKCGASIESLVGCLSEKKYLQPSISEGHITNINPKQIVTDIHASGEGSGAPIFQQSGHVIGVNFTVHREIAATDSNVPIGYDIALPISYGIALLEKSGWRPPEQSVSKDNTSSNTNSSGNTAQPDKPIGIQLKEYLDKLQQLEQQRAKLLVTYTPESPGVKKLDNEISDLKKKIQVLREKIFSN